VAWFAAERLNLLAVTGWASARGRYRTAAGLTFCYMTFLLGMLGEAYAGQAADVENSRLAKRFGYHPALSWNARRRSCDHYVQVVSHDFPAMGIGPALLASQAIR